MTYIRLHSAFLITLPPCMTTRPLRFVYRSADISALSRSLNGAEIYISRSVHKCEWHIAHFIKPLPWSNVFVNWISVMFYETGCSSCPCTFFMSECACSYVRVCVCHNVTRLSEDKLSFHAHYTMFEGGKKNKKKT